VNLKFDLLSLMISLLLVISGFGFFEFASGQVNSTVPQSQELQMIQNQSQKNASQIQANGSVGNMTNPCDPSYPDFCVTTYSVNLTCTDIPYRNFTVLNPDTFGLDSDGDGFGCENFDVAFVNSSNTNRSSSINTTLFK
jgi:hypothetical protein